MVLIAREMEDRDLVPIAKYWTEAPPSYLRDMGADPGKIPDFAEWILRLKMQMTLPYAEKASYCTIWEINGMASGHCNVNQIRFNEDAYMHLHIWDPVNRKKGSAQSLIWKSLDFFFKHLGLQKILCEPSAQNTAPNKALHKAGFSYRGNRVCIPGSICYEQKVNTWELSRADYEKGPPPPPAGGM